MKSVLSILVLLLAAPSVLGLDGSLFDFSLRDAEGATLELQKYESAKVVIVVNVASNCGYTYTNYRELQKLYEQYQPHGLEIIGVPSNQFGDQEPGSDADIQLFTKNYGITWPVMAKAEVNGPGTIELFRWLKDGTGQTEINWNFNKFLVVNGKPVKRYPGSVSPNKMANDIRKLLGLETSEL